MCLQFVKTIPHSLIRKRFSILLVSTILRSLEFCDLVIVGARPFAKSFNRRAGTSGFLLAILKVTEMVEVVDLGNRAH
jgi:hypothetical protein